MGNVVFISVNFLLEFRFSVLSQLITMDAHCTFATLAIQRNYFPNINRPVIPGQSRARSRLPEAALEGSK